MKEQDKYKVYDRFIIAENIKKNELVLGEISPKIKLWKYEDVEELRIDFTVTTIQLIEIYRNGNKNGNTKNKPIKLLEEYVDKKGEVRLKEVENSITEDDGSYNFDILVNKKYFKKYFTVLIEE